jgi:nickel/cobalt exporter
MAAAHTAIVFVLGGVAVALERAGGADRWLRGLDLASAIGVAALGAVQLSRRWREVAGGDRHAHEPAARRSDRPRSIVALGAAAGLTPCPSALALLLSAVALHRYGFGLILVAAFSAGVALTLTAAGLLVIGARRAVDRYVGDAPALRWLPVMSSMCVLIIGILLCASAWSPGALPR